MVEPLARVVAAAAALMALPGAPIVPGAPRHGAPAVRVRRPTDLDRARLRREIDEIDGWVIERDGQPVGDARILALLRGRLLRFDVLRIAGSAAIARAALDELLREFPRAWWISEPRGAGVLDGEHSAIELLAGGAG